MHDELEKLITSHTGTIALAKEPEKARLSYPIKHERTSFFGWFQFRVEDREQLAAIDEQMRLHHEVIRHIILKVEPTVNKKAKARSITGQQRDQERKVRKAPVTSVNPELEKQLEDVISGL
jgi:ribosomal protein S6